MNKLLVLLCFFSSSLFAQHIDQLRTALSTKNISALDSFIHQSPQLPGSSLNVVMNLRREIIPGYIELIANIHDNWPNESFFYQLNLIASAKQILYYKLVQKKSKWNGSERIEYFEVIDSSASPSDWRLIETQFEKLYKYPLDKQDLFKNNWQFGFSCGYSGSMPDLWNEIKMNDRRQLNKWLRSPNAEKQLYAIFLIYQLVKDGIHITPEIERIIHIIQSKEASVNICSGCKFYSRSLKELIEAIKNGKLNI